MKMQREEHPNPQFMRDTWQNLNGLWQFEISEEDLHEKEKLSGFINVPFCPESALSGVGNTGFMKTVWYKKQITLPSGADNKRIILHIGACDYKTTVWINGVVSGTHRGGYTPMAFDITDKISGNTFDITVRADDDNTSGDQPAGKQSKDLLSSGCMYTRTTGIWQTVWLESVPVCRVDSIKYRTYTDGTVRIKAKTENAYGKEFSYRVTYNGKDVLNGSTVINNETTDFEFKIDGPKLWAPGKPELYDIVFTLGEDVVKSYFGLREVSAHNGKFYINGRSVFGRFILDQGFYPDGIYTAPDDAELKNDIKIAMDCGYNGARLHQKIFEPRFLYHADKAGYMVWGEHANWLLDISRPQAWKNFVPEWLEAVERDFNHPSIIGWCPFNETQKDQDVSLIDFVYNMTKAVDDTRPVIDTSGWFHGRKCDMPDCHDYEQDPAGFKENYDRLKKGESPAPVADWVGEISKDVCFVSEFGGTWWSYTEKGGWGYGASVANIEEFVNRYKGLVSALLQNEKICAFCYTQLYDVEQEQNGLYTYDRKPKFDTDLIKKITEQKAASENE